MSSSTDPRRIPVRLVLLRPEEGGLGPPFVSGDQAEWNLGHTADGRLSIEGGRVLLASPGLLSPGEEGRATLEPLLPEGWAHVVPGQVLPMHRGRQVIGRAVVLAEEPG